jgi:hypothetical protein
MARRVDAGLQLVAKKGRDAPFGQVGVLEHGSEGRSLLALAELRGVLE